MTFHANLQRVSNCMKGLSADRENGEENLIARIRSSVSKRKVMPTVVGGAIIKQLLQFAMRKAEKTASLSFTLLE